MHWLLIHYGFCQQYRKCYVVAKRLSNIQSLENINALILAGHSHK